MISPEHEYQALVADGRENLLARDTVTAVKMLVLQGLTPDEIAGLYARGAYAFLSRGYDFLKPETMPDYTEHVRAAAYHLTKNRELCMED